LVDVTSSERWQHFRAGFDIFACATKLAPMKKRKSIRKEELLALRKGRNAVLKASVARPVAIWDGKPKLTSVEHDSVHDRGR
jgi:hypothetical protein